MYTVEDKKIIPLIPAADHQSAGINSAGINVSRAQHVTVIICGGVQTDGNARVKIATGTAHATMDGHIKPSVWRTGAATDAAGSDALVAVSYETGEDYFLITITNNVFYVVEIPMTMVPAGKTWLRVEVGNQGASTFVSAVAIVYPRYKPSGTLVRAT